MKTILVLRSVSGSGKSFFADRIKELSPEKVKICCADDYFMVDGKYCFDASKLHAAHKYCQDSFIDAAIDPNIEIIIVANTNAKAKDFEFYKGWAESFNIPVIFSVLENRRGGENTHSVPEETIERQKKNLLNSIMV